MRIANYKHFFTCWGRVFVDLLYVVLCWEMLLHVVDHLIMLLCNLYFEENVVAFSILMY